MQKVSSKLKEKQNMSMPRICFETLKWALFMKSNMTQLLNKGSFWLISCLFFNSITKLMSHYHSGKLAIGVLTIPSLV